MRVMYVLHGISGSGKSTWARRFCAKLPDTWAREIVSARNFFLDKHGIAHFDPDKLGQAHEECQLNARGFMEWANIWTTRAILIVDNTNTTAWAPEVYERMAHHHRWDIRHRFFTAEADRVSRHSCLALST
jgi:adenylylsulfate kinase-like enzyme